MTPNQHSATGQPTVARMKRSPFLPGFVLPSARQPGSSTFAARPSTPSRLPGLRCREARRIPIYYNRRNAGRPADSANHYTSKYLDLPWTPVFPFGYGLSYTTFAYSNLRLSAPKMSPSDSLTVSIDVKNAGDRTGDE